MTANKLDSVGNAQPIEARNAWGYPEINTCRMRRSTGKKATNQPNTFCMT